MNALIELKKKILRALSTNRKLWFIPALLVGVLVLVLSIALKPKLAVTANDGAVRVVDVQPLTLSQIAPQVIGFGQVRPKQQWSAIAEVTGEIIFKAPQLAKGESIVAGTELLRIDPLKYELALAQAKADLNSNELQLAKLKQEQKNLGNNLKIEQRRLDLQKKENKRLTKLTQQGMLPQSDLDTQRVQLLTQEKTVQELEQQLALFENEKSVAVARINLSKASVDEAQRSIEKTVIVAPRNLKIAQVDIEQNQVVNLNQIMLVGHALEVMEVNAQIAIHDMHTLVSSLNVCQGCSVSPELLSNITAFIELSSGSMHTEWPAKVSRISETIDSNQATVGVILEIDQDPEKLSPENPPLLNGMFIKASLKGQPSLQLSVPEKALHTNRIYLMRTDNTLSILPVSVLYRAHGQAVIKILGEEKILQGDRLVLNDLLPAIEGMALSAKPVVNNQ